MPKSVTQYLRDEADLIECSAICFAEQGFPDPGNCVKTLHEIAGRMRDYGTVADIQLELADPTPGIFAPVVVRGRKRKAKASERT